MDDLRQVETNKVAEWQARIRSIYGSNVSSAYQRIVVETPSGTRSYEVHEVGDVGQEATVDCGDAHSQKQG
jgi:hypothetical protein